MDITEQGKAAVHGGTEAIEEATDRLQRAAGRAADRTQDAAREAWRRTKYAGGEVGDFVRRRPVETALIGVGVACLAAAVAFWCTRGD